MSAKFELVRLLLLRLSRGNADVIFKTNYGPEAAAFNMRDGYDVYPLSGMITLDAHCENDCPVFLRPVVFNHEGSIIFGSWGGTGQIRAWSAKSGRVVGQFDHRGRVHGLKVSCRVLLEQDISFKRMLSIRVRTQGEIFLPLSVMTDKAH